MIHLGVQSIYLVLQTAGSIQSLRAQNATMIEHD